MSYAGFNRAWSGWIADLLERRGLSVTQQRWDLPEGQPVANALHELLLAPGQVLLVLSEWYFQLGPRSHAEWNTALREVVAPNADRFAAVSITSTPVPSAAVVLAPADLRDVDAGEARRRLLARVGLPTEPLPDDSGRFRPRFPLEQPEVWGGVPRRNVRFTGRETQLAEVRRLFQDTDFAAVALHGMSGIGKTQLAMEYVYRFSSEYDVVWWINAEQRVTYRQQLAGLAPRLRLSTGVEYGERIRAVRQALDRGEPFGRWLLVADGADEPDLLWDMLPTGPGDVLLTTRNSEWAQRGAALLEVPFYDRRESVAFIRRRAPRLTEAEADQLAEALEDLPLLLDQTAGWLRDSDMSVQEYIALLADGADQDVISVSADFPLAFETAWAILLTRLRDTAPESLDLLRLCAFFSPGSIPVRLLKGIPAVERPESLVGLMHDPVLWDRTLERLSQYSVIRLESQGAALYMHRMVHQVVRQDIPWDDAQEFAAAVRRALVDAVPGRPGDPEAWPAYAEIVPHLEYADAMHDTDQAVQKLVVDCLRYLYLSGEYGTGLHLAELAVSAWQSLLDPDHPLLWDLGHHYANLLRAVGDYRHSEAVSRAAAERHGAVGGHRDGEYLRAAGSLAADLRALGRYEEAYGLSQEVCDAYEELAGDENHPDVLTARNNLAVSLRLLGDYRRAGDTDRSTLAARRRVLSPRHPWTLFSEIHYATDLRLLGRTGEAVSVQLHSAALHQAELGPDHPQTLRAEHNLALCHYQAGDLTQAESLLTSILMRAERAVGEDDPLSLMFAAAQSCFARERGDLEEARRLGGFVAAHYERMLGPAHPYTAGAHANQALILRAVGEQDEFRALADQAFDDMARAVGPRHPWTLGCALNASSAAAFTGDHEAALAISRDTAPKTREVLGPRHPLSLSALIALAADLRASGDRPGADKTEDAALRDLVATRGVNHPGTRAARNRHRPHWDFEPLTT
ncbi:FxSxx-COOH system tetratricopeptide repeat protein [Streptomyces sp. NPDC060223]|uniref:FxSxx-COOH system tetratricopeptide repeat protein n=1 Tax=unclassified Streptomyces TaxID=2593676 RepID=UPI003633243A